MAIIKLMTLSNGVVAAFHKVIKVTLDWPSDFIQVDIRSYADEATFNSGAPFIYQWRTILNSSSFTNKVTEELETVLVRDSSELSGGYVVANTADLAALKARLWIQIKQARTQVEFGTFTYNGMMLDGDVNAQRRLASYISVSKSAIASGMPFQAEFILANDSVVPLTAQDFVGIEMAKVQQVAAAFAHAVQLRARIDAATTKEEVEAIVW